MPTSRRLLVIDDDRIDRTIAYHAALRAGFEATAVNGVGAACALLREGTSFGYVVLDLSLGRGDGLEMLHALAELDGATIVVFASGFDDRVLAASKRLAASLGLRVGGVLRKPILPAALREILQRAPSACALGATAGPEITAGALRRAIAEREIKLWFQPKVALASDAIIGAEALARWILPDGSVISTAGFVRVAEAHGLIGALTELVLDTALAACAHWRVKRPECSVAVNISPLLLDDPGLADDIDARLQAHGVPPGALVIEITEGSGIPDTALAAESLTRLRIRGVSLAVDDFGTGYSSLLSLVRIPFNELKIDQAFVREAEHSRDSRKVVRASATLGRELGLEVTAEGVETAALAELVRDAGCHVGQGWLYGPAVPADVFEAQLAARPLLIRAAG
jgi:EAL domain-containing protein (putative c-di-GMP-specific phosphodiesterase class I)/FixJ family two-component response regulator